VSRPVDGLDPPSWPRRRSRVEQLEERPGHGPDPRFCALPAYLPVVPAPILRSCDLSRLFTLRPAHSEAGRFYPRLRGWNSRPLPALLLGFSSAPD
jgi:hypothetical protein